MSHRRLVEAFRALQEYLATCEASKEVHAVMDGIEEAIAVLERPETLKERGLASLEAAQETIDRALRR